MEMPLEMTMEKLIAKVKVAEGRNDNIRAFGELWIYFIGENEPLFKVKGFTIRQKEFEGRTVFNVVFPAFKAGMKFQTSFVAEDKSLWKSLLVLFLQEFSRQTEGLGNEDIARLNSQESEEIDPDEVEAGIERMKANQ